MRKTFLKKAREALQEMRAQLLRNVQEELHEGREQTKDEGMDTYDLASDARDREINVILTDRDRDKLQAIDDALARIDAGRAGEGSEDHEALRGGPELPAPGAGRVRRRGELAGRGRARGARGGDGAAVAASLSPLRGRAPAGLALGERGALTAAPSPRRVGGGATGCAPLA